MAQVSFPCFLLIDDHLEIMDPWTTLDEDVDRGFLSNPEIVLVRCADGRQLLENTYSWWHEGHDYPGD
jgi:hypothetical protein